ncbi:MAG: metallophosphoesterase family protein, partial [Candidatus Rhabdochlamydia sp.]
MIRCAHISDLHFAKPSWKINQFFSKKWIGNANFYLRRRSQFCFENIEALPLLFKQLGVSKVMITGDLTTTSDEKEFLMAQTFIQRLEEQGLLVLLLPGNHDQYTKTAFSRKTYYRFFPSCFSKSTCNLKDDGLTVVEIGNKWSAIILDTAIATPPLACYGFFSVKLEERLKQALKQMPKNHKVLILNHFPLLYKESPEKGLKRSEALCDLIKKFPQVNL